MKEMIRVLLCYSILLLVVDGIYLSFIATPFGKMIKKIQGSPMEMKMVPAAIVYLALVCAWYIFIYTHFNDFSIKDNLVRAMFLGMSIYAVYDFTNLALIKDYRVDLAILDSLWGGILFATTTGLYLGIKKFARML